MRELHREFVRAGADVIQAFTFSMDDDMGSSHAKYGVRVFIIVRTADNLDVINLKFISNLKYYYPPPP